MFDPSVYVSMCFYVQGLAPVEAFIEAYKTASKYGYMDGGMKLLAVRLLDMVLYSGLCKGTQTIDCVSVFWIFFSSPLA